MKYLKLFEEWHKVVKTSSSGSTRWIDTIHDDPTSAKSASAGLLLNKEYSEKEFDELKRLGDQYREAEKKFTEQKRIFDILKKQDTK